MNNKLIELTKNSVVVFLLGFLPAPFLVSAGYPPLLVCIFSISIMLLWSDGLLTMFAMGRGATEINPIVKFMNWIAGKKRGFYYLGS